MCVVNMVTKTLEMTNAMHFAKKFVAIVAEMSKTNYEEIRIVFFIITCQILWKKLLETSGQQNNTDPLPSTWWYWN